eukprot:TRINITY_DN10531_c0_g1_i1.p1 TRINITY_DN10531_c0_g1~~TRINITY_DN10531_c0_g1_i1.p1  ORF type:complete len:535 (-),score=128.81 TRINITY_DN10531_c0_g1_i1:240-1844(-)
MCIRDRSNLDRFMEHALPDGDASGSPHSNMAGHASGCSGAPASLQGKDDFRNDPPPHPSLYIDMHDDQQHTMWRPQPLGGRDECSSYSRDSLTEPMLESKDHPDPDSRPQLSNEDNGKLDPVLAPFSVSSGVGIMCSISLGVAVFMLPALFAKTGVLTGVALLLFFGLLSMRIMQLMLATAEAHGCEDMDELAGLVPGGRILVSVSVITTLLVANAGHLQLCSGMLFDLLSWFVADSIGGFAFNSWHKLALLALFLGIALPYTFLEDLSMLKHVGKAVCITCIATCVACAVSCVVKIANGEAVSHQDQAPLAPESIADVFRAIPTVCFVYCSLFPLLHIYKCIKKTRSDIVVARADINKCIVYSTAIQVTAFVAISVICTLTFGKQAGKPKVDLGNGTGNVLYNFPTENYPVTVLCFLLIYVIVLDYPILLFPATKQALKWKACGLDSTQWAYSRHAWALLFTGVILAVVMLVPDLEDVFGLGGSLGMSVHCYIVPGMILAKTEQGFAKKLFGVATALLGGAILVVSTFYIIYK